MGRSKGQQDGILAQSAGGMSMIQMGHQARRLSAYRECPDSRSCCLARTNRSGSGSICPQLEYSLAGTAGIIVIFDHSPDSCRHDRHRLAGSARFWPVPNDS